MMYGGKMNVSVHDGLVLVCVCVLLDAIPLKIVCVLVVRFIPLSVTLQSIGRRMGIECRLTQRQPTFAMAITQRQPTFAMAMIRVVTPPGEHRRVELDANACDSPFDEICKAWVDRSTLRAP